MLGQVGVIEIETPMGKGAGPEGGLRTVIKRCQKVFRDAAHGAAATLQLDKSCT